MKRTSTLTIPFPLQAHAPTARARAFDPLDLSARCTIVALFTLLAVRIGADALATGRVTGLLLLASESLVVVLTVFRRTAGLVDRSLRARFFTGLSMLGPLLVRPASIAPLLNGDITVAASAFGLSIVIAGKLTIGRSFGLLPANRGIVSSGIYGTVRHPIYAGYLITHVAYFAANPSLLNGILLLVGDLALLRRAVCEEATLARDSDYQSYMQRVRWRICPGVF
jgi:protein-S-isoprenylcysteine O-methyltransferase Ste14